MIIFSEEKFPPLSVGDTITLFVPAVDRVPLDFNYIFDVITQFENNVNRVGRMEGLIESWFPPMENTKSGKYISEYFCIYQKSYDMRYSH